MGTWCALNAAHREASGCIAQAPINAELFVSNLCRLSLLSGLRLQLRNLILMGALLNYALLMISKSSLQPSKM